MKYVILAVLSGVLVCSARGQTVQVPVTPNQLEYSNFVFSVTNAPAGQGAAFHVTITTKTQPIGQDCAACVSVVNGAFKFPGITGMTPPVPVVIAKTDGVWNADFTAPAEVLNNPDVCFIFVVPDYATGPDGKKVYLPSDRIYEIRLQDFLKR